MLRQSVNWDYKWSQIVGRAWADDNFKKRLLANPAGALNEYDLPSPAGLRIEVLDNPNRVPEDTDGVMHLVLPGKPSAAELSEDELCSVGGSGAVNRCGCEDCHRCEQCHRCHCEWCGGCHHPPKPDEN
jgi:hypothetical protein